MSSVSLVCLCAFFSLFPYPFSLPLWRRGWDSNPRWTHAHTRSPGAHLRPLGHLSRKARRRDEGERRRRPANSAPPRTRDAWDRVLVVFSLLLSPFSLPYWRRGWDSNPRVEWTPLHDFESCAFNRTRPPLREAWRKEKGERRRRPRLRSLAMRARGRRSRRLLLSPSSLFPAFLAPPARFERATLNLGGSCSIRLSYGGEVRQGEGKKVEGKEGSRASHKPLAAAVFILSPLSLILAFLVRPARFERATPGSGGQCSIR